MSCLTHQEVRRAFRKESCSKSLKRLEILAFQIYIFDTIIYIGNLKQTKTTMIC